MVSESLFFEDHLNFYKRLYAVTDKPHESVIKQAWHMHAFTVFNPLRDLSSEIYQAEKQLKSWDAKKFLTFGAGRRLSAIWHSYSSIVQVAYAERIEPLKEDESHELSKDINLLYIHLRGVLDNYAWVYCYEKEPALLKDEKGNERKFIGLFNAAFPKESKNKNFWNELLGKRAI